MKIFFPFKIESSNYFDEIIKHSTHEFVFGNYKSYSIDYNVVNIHWPESIFDWVEPTTEQLLEFGNLIYDWKKHSKIIFTVHNLKPHSKQTSNYIALYQLIEKNSDVFIHLGEYSKNMFLKTYPNAKHVVLRHPLFKHSNKIYNKDDARKILGINKQSLAIIAPGRIRSIAEKKLVLKIFGMVKRKNKVLLSTNMRKETKFIEFPGRYKLKRFVDLNLIYQKFFLKKYNAPEYIFNYGFMDIDDFSLMMSAADIVVVPRIEILNSGIVFLGLTYNKIVVGPNQGNITEHLKLFNYPIFDPKSSKSINQAINQAITLFEKNEFVNDDLVMEQFYPENVAINYDKILCSLFKN